VDRKVTAAAISVASNATLIAAKIAAGIITGSVSIISEAAHSALDLFAATIALFSVRVSRQPADRGHPYGHGKAENLSGAVEAILILAAAAFIAHEAVDKLRNPKPLEAPLLGVYVMTFSVIVNTLVSRYLFLVARATDSIAIEADAEHLRTDVWTSAGVFLTLSLIQITGWHLLDPIVALVVAVMIAKVAFSLTWKAAGPLMDARLPDAELEELSNIIMTSPNVIGYHKLRTRKTGPGREIDVHIILPRSMPLEEAHAIAERVEDQMRDRFPNTHVVTHVEPDTEDTMGVPETTTKNHDEPAKESDDTQGG